MKFIRVATIFVFIASTVFYAFGKQSTMRSDMTPPVITAESDSLELEAGSDESDLLQGLTATDNRDGDLTSEILVGKVSEFIEKGTCTVEYLVFDKSNNVGRYERTVTYKSYESPKFNLTKPLIYKQNGSIKISDRLYAEDVLEGDISEKIRYSASNVDRTKCGTYELTVVVKNQYGDEVEETLPINVVSQDVDTERIQLKSYLIYVKKGTNIVPEEYIKRVTDADGNELGSETVTITSQVKTSTAGSGQICYEVYDGENVISATYLTVIVTE